MGGAEMCTPVTEPIRTLTTKGHQSLLVPYYGTGVARPVTEPVGAMTAKDRYGLATGLIDVDDVMFRMLEPGEIGAAMAFSADYIVLGNKRERRPPVRQRRHPAGRRGHRLGAGRGDQRRGTGRLVADAICRTLAKMASHWMLA